MASGWRTELCGVVTVKEKPNLALWNSPESRLCQLWDTAWLCGAVLGEGALQVCVEQGSGSPTAGTAVGSCVPTVIYLISALFGQGPIHHASHFGTAGW